MAARGSVLNVGLLAEDELLHLGADLVVADLGRLVVELRLGAGSGAGASSAAGCSPAGAASTAARLAAADTAGQSLQLAQMRGAWVR